MARRRRSDGPSLAENFSELRNDYAAAKTSRFRRRRTGVAAAGSGADYHYRNESDYLRLMEFARDMDRNDCLVGQTIDRAVMNTVQDGFVLDPTTGDEELDKDLAARWNDWAEDPDQCDTAGERTFWEMETLALRQSMVDGDILALPIRDGTLQMVEGHRLRRPRGTRRKNCVHGVLLDDHRRRLEYWITKDDVDPMQTVQRVSEISRYPARDKQGNRQVFQIYTSKRVSQTRGVSALAPIFDLCGMFEDINFANLVRAQVASCFAIFRERPTGFSGVGKQTTGEQTTDTLSDGSSRTIEGIAPGMEYLGMDGEKFKMDSPNVPNPEFFPHAKLIMQLIGVNLGLPLVLVLLDAKETNFSGWRGAVDQARLGFRQNQKRLSQRLHRPTYQWKVRQWMADDAAIRHSAENLKDQIFSHKWRCPRWTYIEPMKDAAARLLRTRNGQTSQRRAASEDGIDWEDLSSEIVEDNAKLIRKAHETAVQLNKENKDLNITWREVANLPTPDGLNISVSTEAADVQPDNSNKDQQDGQK